MTSGSSFPMELVSIGRDMRTNLTITDKQGVTAKLNDMFSIGMHRIFPEHT
jgi:hypothetical protein